MDGEDQKYWTGGHPYEPLSSPAEETGGSQKFWTNGEPFELLTPEIEDTAAMFMLFL